MGVVVVGSAYNIHVNATGTGGKPELGELAAQESQEALHQAVAGSDMVWV